MHFPTKEFAKRKPLAGAILAAGLLAVIFIPFQAAEAAVVTFGFEGQTFSRQDRPMVQYEVELGPGEQICNPVLHEFNPGTSSPGVEGGTINYQTEQFKPTKGTGTPASLITKVNVEIELGLYGNISGNCINGPAHITVTFQLGVKELQPGAQTLTVSINGPHQAHFFVTKK